MKDKAKFGSGKPMSKENYNKNSGSVLAMKEDLAQMTSTDQIVLIESLAEKITGNSGTNVRNWG